MRAGAPAKPLAGWNVLVPRGGAWGDSVAALLRAQGASPVVAPLINFAAADDGAALDSALRELADGAFDWITVTSATTVDVLASLRAVVPERTRIAAVGETTAAALSAAGYRADFVPSDDNSASGMLREWVELPSSAEPQRILALRSSIAKPVLTAGLRRMGNDVESVVAYRTVGVAAPQGVVQQVAEGALQAIMVTSGSVAEQVHAQFGEVPERTIVACIGPTTAADARRYGLRVDLVAETPGAQSLIDALVAAAR